MVRFFKDLTLEEQVYLNSLRYHDVYSLRSHANCKINPPLTLAEACGILEELKFSNEPLEDEIPF